MIWLLRQARAGCYSQAELSSNDSKTLYNSIKLVTKHLPVPILNVMVLQTLHSLLDRKGGLLDVLGEIEP